MSLAGKGWRRGPPEADHHVRRCGVVFATGRPSPAAGEDVRLLLPELVLVGAREERVRQHGHRPEHVHARGSSAARRLQARNPKYLIRRVRFVL